MKRLAATILCFAMLSTALAAPAVIVLRKNYSYIDPDTKARIAVSAFGRQYLDVSVKPPGRPKVFLTGIQRGECINWDTPEKTRHVTFIEWDTSITSKSIQILLLDGEGVNCHELH